MARSRRREALMPVRTMLIVTLAMLPGVGAGAAAYVSLPSSPMAPLVAFCAGFGAWLAAAAALDQMIAN